MDCQVLTDITRHTLEPLHYMGHTPNAVTTYSLLFGVLALHYP